LNFDGIVIAAIKIMKSNVLRTVICGTVLSLFAIGTTAMACHDGQNPNHKKHHKKTAMTAPAYNPSTGYDPAGLPSNG
jgi:hypothetical protein